MRMMLPKPKTVLLPAALLLFAGGGAEARDPDPVDSSLLFTGGEHSPGPGLDPALVRLARERRVVHAFAGVRGRVGADVRRALRRAGARVLGYHPEGCLKVAVPARSLRRIAGLPMLRFLVRQPDRLRLHPSLAGPGEDPAAGDLALFITAMDPGAGSIQHLTRRLRLLGGRALGTDAALGTVTVTLPAGALARVASWDEVLFIEPRPEGRLEMDEAVAMIGADLGRTSTSGSKVIAGIIDSGLNRIHTDLKSVKSRGWSYTGQGGPYDDYTGHGTIVAGIMMGRGLGDPRYGGVAPGLAATDVRPLLVAKIVTSQGGLTGADKAIDQFVKGSAVVGKPQVVNCSWSIKQSKPPGDDPGSSYWARKVDHAVYTSKEVFVYAAGNGMDSNGDGKVDYYGPRSIKTPALAKNALAVGAVATYGFGKAGSVWSSSGKGPTKDGRLKPNVVAPGTAITSVWGKKSSGYASASGTSFAAPVATALVARLLDREPALSWKPSAVRALVMATALPLGGKVSGIGNTAGTGRISADLLLGKRDAADGWKVFRLSGSLAAGKHGAHDLTLPQGAHRLTTVLTWDEPPASAGAARAVANDLDLWLDLGADQGKADGTGGEWSSTSKVDNTEYVAVDSPGSGKLRVKVVAHKVPVGSPQRYDLALLVARGDPVPRTDITLRAEVPDAAAGSTLGLVAEVRPRSFLLGGAVVKLDLPAGVKVLSSTTARRDGVSLLQGPGEDEVVLGDIPVGSSRKARFVITSNAPGAVKVTARLHALAFKGPGKTGVTVWFCKGQAGCAPRDAGPADGPVGGDGLAADHGAGCPRPDGGAAACPADDGCSLAGQGGAGGFLGMLLCALLLALRAARRRSRGRRAGLDGS